MNLLKKAAIGLIACVIMVLGLNSPGYCLTTPDTGKTTESKVKNSSGSSTQVKQSQSSQKSSTKAKKSSSQSSKSTKPGTSSKSQKTTTKANATAKKSDSSSKTSGVSSATAAPTATSSLSGEAESTQMHAGNASWFGKFHHGKKTASGEPFDMFAMTAAHRELPFGTVLRVTNTDNNRVVLVRVNDRGPFRGSRVLDLSFAAADRLGMSRDGVAHVSFEEVTDSKGNLTTPGNAFYVSLDNPTARFHRVDSAAIEEQLVKLFRVGLYSEALKLSTSPQGLLLGPYDTFDSAHDALMKVYTTHPDAAVTLVSRRDVAPAQSSFAEATTVK